MLNCVTMLDIYRETIMALDTWFLFFLTSVGMSLSPGPNGLLALTHGAMHGSRKTLFTIMGGILGLPP